LTNDDRYMIKTMKKAEVKVRSLVYFKICFPEINFQLAESSFCIPCLGAFEDVKRLL
jgi:hypothetical protein